MEFTRSGHFEEAYRFVERWIRKHADQTDGLCVEPPSDHLDLREDGSFWMLEKVFHQYMEDLQTAIDRQINLLETLETERPNEGVSGETTVESRITALQGILKHIVQFKTDVDSAVLSPQTVRFLKSIGIDSAQDSNDEKDPP